MMRVGKKEITEAWSVSSMFCWTAGLCAFDSLARSDAFQNPSDNCQPHECCASSFNLLQTRRITIVGVSTEQTLSSSESSLEDVAFRVGKLSAHTLQSGPVQPITGTVGGHLGLIRLPWYGLTWLILIPAQSLPHSILTAVFGRAHSQTPHFAVPRQTQKVDLRHGDPDPMWCHSLSIARGLPSNKREQVKFVG
ncbi:hypothetical protein BDW67DRAFT_52385 [Aspergillus spinulosporus]